MKRYIDADDFKKEIMECNADPINEFDLGWDTWGIFNAIDRTPTADVAPVVHAHWVDFGGNYMPVNDNGFPEGDCLCSCSACGDYLTASDEYNVRGFYCPNCGAKMDEEKEG